MAFEPSDEECITVFAAASTTDAIEAIGEAFTGQTGIPLQTSYAGSSTLAQQITHGATADIFLSANVRWADSVQEHVAVARRRDLLGNRLVVVVGRESKVDLKQPADLLSDQVKYLALGDPEAVPAGIYAKQALTALNLWDDLHSKVAPAKDVRDALTYVAMGAAEAGIVYATDAAISRQVRVAFEIPPQLTRRICYPVLLLDGLGDRAAAIAFYDYLASDQAKDVFERFGFVVLTDGASEEPTINSDNSLVDEESR